MRFASRSGCIPLCSAVCIRKGQRHRIRPPWYSEVNLCSEPDVTIVIKSTRMRPTGHIARMGNVRNAYNT
jgi:hypothetical protein